MISPTLARVTSGSNLWSASPTFTTRVTVAGADAVVEETSEELVLWPLTRLATLYIAMKDAHFSCTMVLVVLVHFDAIRREVRVRVAKSRKESEKNVQRTMTSEGEARKRRSISVKGGRKSSSERGAMALRGYTKNNRSMITKWA